MSKMAQLHADFTELKQRVTLVEVLNQYVPEEKRSEYNEKENKLRGPCILCGNEKRRELSINTNRNCFRTFCCNNSGNLFDFVAIRKKRTVSETCYLIAGWFDLEQGEPAEEQPDLPAENAPLSFQLRNVDPSHTICIRLGVFGAGFTPISEQDGGGFVGDWW